MAGSYNILVDWDNNGNYTGTYDTQPVLEAQGVGFRAGRDQPKTYQPTRVGQASWSADGRDKRFSDPSGVLAGSLKPYRPCKIQYNDGTTTYDLFTGVVDNWQVKLDNYPMVAADFAAVDRLGQLARVTLSTPLYNDITTDQAALYVLQAANQASNYSFDTGYTTLGYWWAEGKTALAALQELADHEQGFIYVKRDGTLVFENRYNRVDRPMPVATLDDASTVSNAAWKTNVKDVVNRVTVTVEPRSQAGVLSAVWQAQYAVTLGPNETQTITANSNDPFTAAVTPVSGTDYTTSSGSVTSVTLDRTSGQACKITVTAGASGATLTGLQLRAYAVTKTSTVTWIAEDITSQADYGLVALTISLPYLSNAYVGRDAAQAIVGRYAQPVELVDVTLIGNNVNKDTRQSLNATLGVSDRVTLFLPSIGINWNGFIEFVQHTIRYGAHKAVYSVQRAVMEAVAKLDDDVYGILDDDSCRLGW